MRTSLRVLAIAAVAAVPAGTAGIATATRPANPGPAAAAKKKPACKPAPRAGVAFVIRGVLVSDATPGEVVLRVTGGNAHGLRAVRNAPLGIYDPGHVIKIATCTRITKHGKRPRPQRWGSLDQGERVLVSWKAKRGTAFADLGAAHRVIELGR